MNTTLSRAILRVHLNPKHARQLQTIAARIAAVTGQKEASMPVLLRAGIQALEQQAIAATKELEKSKDGEYGAKVWRLRTAMNDARQCSPASGVEPGV
jgi:hypothetical protein